jgi:CHRD domain
VSFRQRSYYVHAAILVLAFTAPAFAADVQYGTELDPVAFDNSTVKNNVGIGHVTAALSGSTLTVTGDYSGLSSEATAANLVMGLGRGVAGGATGGMNGSTVGKLTIGGSMDGQISGSIKLTSAQIAALKKGALYIEIDSAKAPNGNLWGWLTVADQNQ